MDLPPLSFTITGLDSWAGLGVVLGLGVWGWSWAWGWGAARVQRPSLRPAAAAGATTVRCRFAAAPTMSAPPAPVPGLGVEAGGLAVGAGALGLGLGAGALQPPAGQSSFAVGVAVRAMIADEGCPPRDEGLRCDRDQRPGHGRETGPCLRRGYRLARDQQGIGLGAPVRPTDSSPSTAAPCSFSAPLSTAPTASVKMLPCPVGSVPVRGLSAA